MTAADSSRSLPPRTAGLLSGQDVLTVPDMRSKILCQCAGFGVGYLPINLVRAELKAGQLVVKQVLEPKPGAQLFIAWRSGNRGRALKWFLDRLGDKKLLKTLLA